MSVHEDGVVRVWDAILGNLEWDDVERGNNATARMKSVDGKIVVAVVRRDIALVRLGGLGRKDNVDVQLEGGMPEDIDLDNSLKPTVVGSGNDKSKVVIWNVDFQNQKVETQKEVDGVKIAVYNRYVLLLRDGRLILVDGNDFSEQILDVASHGISGISDASLISCSGKEDSLYVSLVDSASKSFSALVNLKLRSVTLVATSTQEKKIVGFSASGFIYSLSGETSKLEESSKTITLDVAKTDRGLVRQVWVVQSSDQQMNYLALFDDESLVMLKGSKTAWVREESFSSIADAAFLDCPPHSRLFAVLESNSEELKFPGFFQRISTQIAELRLFFNDIIKSVLDVSLFKAAIQNSVKLSKEKIGGKQSYRYSHFFREISCYRNFLW